MKIMGIHTIGNSEWSEGELGTFKKRVMRRVYWNWFIRKALFPGLVVLPAAIFLIIREMQTFTIKTILANTFLKLSHFNVIGLFNLVVIAIRQAEIDTLLITISSILLVIIFARRLIREFYGFITSNAASMVRMPRVRRS